MNTEDVKYRLMLKLNTLLEEFDIKMKAYEFVHTYKGLYIQNEPPMVFNHETNTYEQKEKPRIRLLGMCKDFDNTYKKRQIFSLGASEYVSLFVFDKIMNLFNRLSMIVFIAQELQMIEKLEKRQAKFDAWTTGEMAFEKFGNFGESDQPDSNFSFMESNQILKWNIEKEPRTKLLRKLFEKEKDPNLGNLLRFEFKLLEDD